MWRNRIGWAALILLALALLIRTNTYYAAWLFAVVILIPLISLALMLLAAGHLSMELKIAPILEKGGDTSFYYLLKNDSHLPLARVTFDTDLENQMTFSKSKKRTRTGVPAKGVRRSRYEIADASAGTMTVDTRRIRVQDAFGIFSVRKGSLPEAVTVIYPRLRDVGIYLNTPVETLGDGRRWADDRKGNDVSEVLQVREYQPGDDVRRIHWKLTEKMDQTMVRDFALPLNYSVTLLLELTKAEEEVMDRALEMYVSFSRVLMEKGIQHNMAWYDAADQQLHVHELNDMSDLEVALAELLASSAYEQENAALETYAQSVYCNPRNTLLYVATKPDEEKVAELEVRQQVRLVDARQEECGEVWI